ncbi:hypothetical protein HETIRDRAFT_384394 [Heterobasidion irregulare TC 32-1]|uniref:Uncharacterized protein n=1 Tax=Heterobasidion irregulare (strain TC 32-1) TaxID=747525 RepID=W4K9B4_HETIT|nr:uncharacterized protein HETIRDRAFT_384394 [Heterobasidion irregulare TC 32-1]ETW81945.1 hypothetical protein HETIRDRAFT_384394 [Heterobasidion irregulare TC 32-1]
MCCIFCSRPSRHLVYCTVLIRQTFLSVYDAYSEFDGASGCTITMTSLCLPFLVSKFD